MEKYDGLKLNPLFWSEISSSYMVHDIFEHRKDVAIEFMHKFLDLKIDKDSDIEISREYPLLNKGSIDLLVKIHHAETNIYVLIEAKVHDYASATKGQIKTYYDAALEKFKQSEIYFIYLTQFNRKNFPTQSFELPLSIREFEESEINFGKNKSKLKHMTWQEFHEFISGYRGVFDKEESLMLDFQEQWISAKCEKDLKSKKVEGGERDLSHYFNDFKGKLNEELNFGKIRETNKRTMLESDLSKCDTEKLRKVLEVIRSFSDSGNVDKNAILNSEDFTLRAAKEFLNSLVQDQTRWGLLSFYSSFFNLVNEKKYLKLDGTGASGFSIKLKIKEKGEISLCTLRCNNQDIIDFGLKR